MTLCASLSLQCHNMKTPQTLKTIKQPKIEIFLYACKAINGHSLQLDALSCLIRVDEAPTKQGQHELVLPWRASRWLMCQIFQVRCSDEVGPKACLESGLKHAFATVTRAVEDVIHLVTLSSHCTCTNCKEVVCDASVTSEWPKDDLVVHLLHSCCTRFEGEAPWRGVLIAKHALKWKSALTRVRNHLGIIHKG